MKHQIKSLAFVVLMALSLGSLGQSNAQVEPQTVAELVSLYGQDARDKSWGILDRPKISPDGNVYIFFARIEKSESKNVFLGLTPDVSGTRYYSINEIPSRLLKKYELNARINETVAVAGRYIGNITYRTIGGETKTAPKFLVEHIIF